MQQETSNLLRVEFYPTVDDYVYVAAKINDRVPSTPFSIYAFHIFALINLVLFPAFLWYSDQFLLGTFVFMLNVSFVILYLPRVNKSAYKEYYEQLLGNIETKIAIVELLPEGLQYLHDGVETFYPWKKFT